MKRKFTLLTAVWVLLAFLAYPNGMKGQERTSVTDELTRDLIGVTSTSYASWSGVTSNSDAVYAGQSAGGNNSIQLRSNNSNSGIVTTTSGGTVTNVQVSWNSNTTTGRTLNVYGKDSAYSSPTDLYNNSLQGTLLGTIVCGTSTSISIDGSYAYIGLRSASGAMYLEEIDITWSTGGGQQPTVATPTFSPAGGTYVSAQTVTINCETTGATIYYTTDGTNPQVTPTGVSGNQYTSPITISQTTTLKAMAVKDNMANSSVASATYTIHEMTTLTTIADIWDLADSVGTTTTSAYVTFNDWYVTGVKNNQVCVSDGQYGFVIYQSGHGFTAGDKLNGTVACNVLKYQNHYAELTGVTASSLTVTSGQEMPMLTTTIGALEVRNYGTPISLGTLTYDGTKFNDNSGASITPYNNFNLNPNPITSLESNKEYDVKGVYIVYWQSNNPVRQVAPRSAEDFEEITVPTPTQTVATPTFSPTAGTYTEAQTVTISCATQGATIYYTTDGSDPGNMAGPTPGNTYTSPFTISETTTVKAIAVKQGMNNSSIATATYTIQQLTALSTIGEIWIFADSVGTTATQASVTFNNWYVTGVKSNQVCVSDGQYGFVIYQSGHGFNAGDKLNGTVTCNVLMYQNHYAELTGVKASNLTVTPGQEMPLLATSISDLDVMNYGTALDLDVLTFNGTAFEDDARRAIITPYNNFNLSPNPVTSLEANKQYHVKGVSIVYWQNNSPIQQIAPRSASDFEEVTPSQTVPTPTFTPEAGDYTEEISVTIACLYEDATIYYTLDGSDPVTPTGITGTEYTQPIVLSDTTTVKAVAVMQGMNNSEIATAVYNINIIPPAQETSYTLITNANALITGDKYIIVGVKNDAYKAMSKQAQNNRPAVDVTVSNDTITVTPANQSGLDAVYEFTLGQENGHWTLYDAASGGYLYAASSSSNYLRTQAQNDANGEWTIEIASDGVATIKAQGANTRNWLRLNNNGSPFSCYASGQMNVYLYKAGEVPPVPYFTINVAETSNGTVTVSQDGALENDTIYVNAVPNEGYELTTLSYSYIGSTPISIMETGYFLMPASDVIVNAVFTELAHVAAPTFSPVEGTYITAQTVSIASTTQGATIYYTTDGSDPTPNSSVYSEPFTVSETTTVKAFAVKDEMNDSEIASITYTILEPMSIAEAKTLAADEYALVQGVVTFIDGRNVYIQDESAGIDLYLNNNTVPSTLAIGDMVLGYGKKTTYNGLIELTSINGGNANQFVILSGGNELPLSVTTIAEILADNNSGANLLQSTRVQVVNATIGAINTNNNTPITQDGSTINIYKMPAVQGLEEGDFVTVTGIIGCYNAPQLRVSSANDVEFTHPAGITISPTSLAGFNYVYDEGPSTIKSFVITGRSLTATTHIIAPESYEMSSFPGEAFYPESQVNINTYTGNYTYTIKVRLKAGLEIGTYDETITIYQDEVDTLYIALSGSVTAQPQPGEDYVRISDLSQIGNGAKVIFAARYNENVNEYFAMTAQTTGKPEGVLFTSVTGTDAETLPAEITDAESTYYWTVSTDGTNYTFTNADGNVLGYTSSTNFSTGGDNINWTIEAATSEATAMVPEYSAFNVINGNVTNRAFALNSNHNYGPYHTQNMNSESYNFFIDMFVTGGGTITPTCAIPTFDPVGGTYFETLSVAISCSTPDATIYYTLDGSDPTPNSLVYSEPIEVVEDVTIKAYAVKEGYNDSNIAEAEYTLILGAVTIFNQDWEGEMNGWTFVTVVGSKPWTIGQYSGNHYAYGNGYNGGANEQWCISPAINLEQYSDVSLNFMNAKNYTGPDLQLFFSNNYDGANPSDATWTELAFEKSPGSFTWTESGSISLANFTGENCYIGFKYTSTETEAAAWEIDDIMLMGFTSDPVLNVTPLSLSFSYMEGNGPSSEQSFLISGFNLTNNVIITIEGEDFEMSDISGDDFDPMEEMELEPYEGTIDEIIYVRMAEGLEAGSYTATITVTSELDDITVDLTGTVMEPIQSGDWNRISSLADLHDGDQVVIAARYDATVGDGYYAMTAGVSGKPDGVLFTSVNENGIEMLPGEIVADITTFAWIVTVNDTLITLTNADGDLLGYSSSTNFAGNTSTEWSIGCATSGENAMVPNYAGFVITNVETNNRCIVMNANYKFGAYHTNNINSGDYNFYLDLFVLGGSATQTVATPVFSVASGTYYEEFDVEITCATEGATIYYTTDGSEPTAESTIYEEAIHVDSDVTLKAIAMMEDYENSAVATVSYVVITGQTVILQQDWEGEMNGWTFVTIEGNKPWSIGSYNGNHYAYTNGYNDDTDNEQWCISPAFDLTYFTDVTLTFRNAMKFTGPDMQLFFSSNYDGEHPSAATWTELFFEKSPGNYTWTESGEISLDGLRGSDCYIAFLYTSDLDNGAAAWEVDDILIVGTAYDAVEESSVTDVNFWSYGNEIFVDNQTSGNVQMTVFNLMGQQVYAKTLGAGSVRFSHNLAKGLYVVTLQNSKGRMSVKMIVR